MSRIHLILFVGILLLGLLPRLYRFDSPIADWHSWRQADTSSVSRNFAENGFDVLHPKFQDLSPSSLNGLENPEGYRFVEFPIYNLAQAGLFNSIGILILEEWGRVISIIMSLLAGVFIFLIVKRHASILAAFSALTFYMLIPFNIYYGRVILPDPSTITSILGGIYFFDLWIENKSKINHRSLAFFILSLMFISLALLLKPFAIFFILPMAYLAFDKFGKKMLLNPYLWVFAIIALIPLVGWRVWMTQFPEGVPGSGWLFNDGNIRFKGSFFYWLFADRIGRLILGYWGVALLVIGFLRKIDKNSLFLFSFFASSLIYFTVIAKGNINHDYYQILVIPSLVILMGLGVEFLIQNSGKLFPKTTGYLVVLVCSVFTFLFGWYFVRDYFNVNNFSIVQAGRAADRILPTDAKVLAPYGGDTAFLYQIHRNGWAHIRENEEHMIDLGATHMVIVNPTDGDRELLNKYETLEDKSNYIILKLQ